MTAGMLAVPTIMPLKEPGSVLSSGSRKWMVDTTTLIDLHTTSKDCLMFYTVDGTKPDPFKKLGNKTTHQFLHPFTLRRGKRTVKAMAVLRDGSKESSINTKVFHVSDPEVLSDEENFNNKTNTSWTTQNDSEEDNMIVNGSLERSRNENLNGKESLIKKVLTDSPRPPETPTLNKSVDEDSFRCFHCNTERPRDPYSRFCNGCGRTLPPAPGGIRTSRFFSGQVTCGKCGYEKASEGSYCKVCDSITKCKRDSKQQQRINCTNCDSMNPVTVESCLVCDEHLDNRLYKGTSSSSNGLMASEKPCDFIQCPFCERTNSCDARYCDWCGGKPHAMSRIYSCPGCQAENDFYADFCSTCGKAMKPPSPKFSDYIINSSEIVYDDSDGGLDETDGDPTNKVHWKKISVKSSPKRANKNVSIQAGSDMESVTSKTKLKSNPSFNMSPGKGYWRQQIDHICHHLKIYAQNNIEFRESVANFVMSRMISGNVKQDDNLNQIAVTVIFGLKGKDLKDKKKLSGAANALTFINALTASTPSLPTSRPSSSRSRPTSARSRPSSARSVTSTTSSASKKKKKVKKKVYEKIEKEKVTEKLAKLSPGNLKVLKMIKSVGGSIDEDEVENLVNTSDFDPNTLDENDIPLLKLSVKHGRLSVIPFLVKSGANVDQISGLQETTALHEAVLLGIKGKAAVSTLIDNGASIDVKDKKGSTPFDYAIESGIDSLIEKFNKLTSKTLLNDMKI